jgi:hypothetical protein
MGLVYGITGKIEMLVSELREQSFMRGGSWRRTKNVEVLMQDGGSSRNPAGVAPKSGRRRQ